MTESEPRFGRRSKLAQRWLTDGRGFDLRLPLSVTQDHWKTPVKAMTVAYEDVLRELKLADRADPLTEMIAKKIIELAQTGERDPKRLCEHALQAIQGEGSSRH